MKNIIITFLFVILLVQPLLVSGTSVGDDDSTPPSGGGGGGGGGGGAPEFFDYYVPLVFGVNHSQGESEIVVWFFQPSILITDFGLNRAGINQARVESPSKRIFRPSTNPGLTNGSLIRTTTPVLISSQRANEDIYSDESFAYSILPSRMMGFEYVAPFDGYLNLVTLTPGTTVGVNNPGFGSYLQPIPVISRAITVKVKAGALVNSSFPTNGAFISYDGGTFANMAVPKFLKGSEYIFDTNYSRSRIDEIDQSKLRIIPEGPTELEFQFANGSKSSAIIFGNTDFKVDKNLRSVQSLREDITVNLLISKVYAGLTRKSTVQLFAAPEMRSGELFLAPKGYSLHLTAINDNTEYLSIAYDPSIDVSNYILTSKPNITANRLDSISFASSRDIYLLWGNDSSFGYLSSPGYIGHPMSPSLSFVNIPLNSQTSRNITGVTATWYRFPNLAVYSIGIEPGPPEEYTGQSIKVVIGSNGSLPAGRFQVQIIIDDEIEVEETYDFLQVNDTLVFEFERFITFGTQRINVTARVDVENEVNEINEDDNKLSFGTVIQENIRLRWSIQGLIVIVAIFIGRKLWLRIRSSQRRNRAHVDVILNFEEGSE